MDGNSDNTIRETAEFETNEVEKLGARVSELERELISTKNHLENVEGKLKRETEELSKIEPERNRLQVANLELIATIESQKSEIAKEQREAQSKAEEENLRLKLQINDLKYGVGSTSRVPNIPTIPNSPNQGTTAP
ncbi:1458_t:CDS:2, partial [Racocetra persica]